MCNFKDYKIYFDSLSKRLQPTITYDTRSVPVRAIGFAVTASSSAKHASIVLFRSNTLKKVSRVFFTQTTFSRGATTYVIRLLALMADGLGGAALSVVSASMAGSFSRPVSDKASAVLRQEITAWNEQICVRV